MPAVNVVLTGRKEWVLFPPQDARYERTHRDWRGGGVGGEEAGVLRCTQEEDDLVLVPEFFAHGVRNLQVTVPPDQ